MMKTNRFMLGCGPYDAFFSPQYNWVTPRYLADQGTMRQ
jgi:hypothetical protein